MRVKNLLVGISVILGCILIVTNVAATQYVWSELSWEYDAESKIRSGIIVGSDGVIYFGTYWPSKAIALNPDGSLKWEYAVPNSIYSGFALSNDESVVYCGDMSYNLHAIYTTNGTLKWNYTDVNILEIMSGIAVDDNDKIYFGDTNTSVTSLNYDGTLNWQQNYTGESDCQIKIKNSTVGYVVGYAGLFEFNLSDGSQNWNYSHTAQGTGVSIASDGTIYYGGHDFHAINPNGSEKWVYSTLTGAQTANAIGTNDHIWFIADQSVVPLDKDLRVTVLNPDGTLDWEYYLWDWVGSGFDTTGLALDSNNVVYVGCRDHNLYAINSDGTLKWIFTAGDDIRSGIAFSPSEDTVYFGSDDGYLYAITTHRFDPSHGIYGNVYLLPLYSAGKDTDIICKNDTFSISTVANNTGYYIFDDIDPGNYWINASKFSYIDNSAIVEIVSGYNQTLLDGCDAL